MNPLLTKTILGAVVGAAQASGAVPGASFMLVANAAAKLAKQPKAVEFIARGIHSAELKGSWAVLSASEQTLWRQRAANALSALQALAEHAAKAALDTAADPQKLAELVSTLLAKAAKPTSKAPGGNADR